MKDDMLKENEEEVLYMELYDDEKRYLLESEELKNAYRRERDIEKWPK